MFFVQKRGLPRYLLQVEIRRNPGVVVDVARCSRQAVEICKDEPADAVQFEGFAQHLIKFGEELFPR